ncbi:hypothetical protein [Evansella tamaricis]|uniref:Uncharacterized protein n=1 Tax=Evansella tamaricis TaxID=2069301 RepID=A0ABS6JPZ2_9BACI|nr:hypothetical protein [Evansella tamaricis]MBU9714440.1 hypothetical protein [Evansella tamaricis]
MKNGLLEMVNYQARYMSYCKAKGIEPGAHFKSWDYIVWVQDKSEQFKRENGINSLNSDELHRKFTSWLLKEVS